MQHPLGRAAVLALVALTSLLGGVRHAIAAPIHPVVVELFTSQGCSSCPPADRLLQELGREMKGDVIPLAYHVDYWNHLGWKDPFSSALWSQRQERYVRRLGPNLYTPQAVVGGGAQVLGSDGKGLVAAVRQAAHRPAAELALTIGAGSTRCDVGVDIALPEALAERKLDLMVALYERGLVTAVGRGENGGRTLRDDYVVRRLVRLERFDKPTSSSWRAEGSVELEAAWTRDRLGVAAFLQDPATLEIVGAASRAFVATTRP